MSTELKDFVDEITDLHHETLNKKIETCHEINKYSNWFLGLSTAALGLLIANYDKLIKNTWISHEYSSPVLIIVGLMLLLSICLGATHHHYSIKENFELRLMITCIGIQKYLFKHIDKNSKKHSYEKIQDDMFEGEYLENEKKSKFIASRKNSEKFRKAKDQLRFSQQLTAIFGYILFFIAAINKAA